MDLLLKVDDVLVRGVNVRVIAELARRQLLLVLSAEVHGDGGLVPATVSKLSTRVDSFL